MKENSHLHIYPICFEWSIDIKQGAGYDTGTRKKFDNKHKTKTKNQERQGGVLNRKAYMGPQKK